MTKASLRVRHLEQGTKNIKVQMTFCEKGPKMKLLVTKWFVIEMSVYKCKGNGGTLKTIISTVSIEYTVLKFSLMTLLNVQYHLNMTLQRLNS